MDYEKKFILGDLVKGLRTFNGEIIKGKFNGFHLHDKLDPTSVIGVICVENDRCYDVVAGSIELLESEDERIRKVLIKGFQHYDKECKWGEFTTTEILAWLEKQGQEPKKVSIWKHWKNGITGNGDGEQIYLIKYGNTYHLSSCLSFECDYIELSELDNLMSEKQDEQKPADEVESKFKVGDKVNRNDREDEEYNILTITSVNIDEHCYTCDQGSVIDFEEQDSWHIVEQKSAWSEEYEDALDIAIRIIQNGGDDCSGILDSNKALNWLKSIKPQKHWKPSEEHMKALHDLTLTGNVYSYVGQRQVLIELYNDLKKLK